MDCQNKCCSSDNSSSTCSESQDACDSNVRRDNVNSAGISDSDLVGDNGSIENVLTAKSTRTGNDNSCGSKKEICCSSKETKTNSIEDVGKTDGNWQKKCCEDDSCDKIAVKSMQLHPEESYDINQVPAEGKDLGTEGNTCDDECCGSENDSLKFKRKIEEKNVESQDLESKGKTCDDICCGSEKSKGSNVDESDDCCQVDRCVKEMNDMDTCTTKSKDTSCCSNNPDKSCDEKASFVEEADEHFDKQSDSCCEANEFSSDCNKKTKDQSCSANKEAKGCCKKEGQPGKLCVNEKEERCKSALKYSSNEDTLCQENKKLGEEKSASGCCGDTLVEEAKEEKSGSCCKKASRFNVSKSGKKLPDLLSKEVVDGDIIFANEGAIGKKDSCCKKTWGETNDDKYGDGSEVLKNNFQDSEGVEGSPIVGKKLLSEMGNKVTYGSISCFEPTDGKRSGSDSHKYASLPTDVLNIENDFENKEASVEIKPVVTITTKLRIQNICCGKEAELMKRELEPLNGIEAVSVNVVGRIGFIRHDKEIISAVQIVGILNNLHLGVSIMESGHNEAEQVLKKEIIVKLGTKCAILAVLLVLFIVVIIGRVHDHSWQKWVAIAEIVIGSLPILRKVVLNWLKKVFIDINLLMLIAVAGTIALNEWIEGATLVFVFAIAEVLQQYCGYKVQAAISGILVHVPDHAVLAETGKSVPVEEIDVGSRIVVCAGEKIALDGDVVKGQASVDESSITGESMPIEKGPGSKTYSGTIIQSGYLEIKTTSTAEDSTVSKVTQMVQEAQSKSSHAEKMMNQFAKYYTPLVLVIALLVFAIPAVLAELKVGNYSDQLHWWGIRALIVLLIACPCALVMSVPIPMVCGITKAAKNGSLVKSGTDMELLAGIKAIAFDKTGTLTEGRFKVVNIKEFEKDKDFNEMLEMLTALESKSSHPVAAAIVNHYSGCITDKIANFGAGVGLPDVVNFKTVPGLGLTGRVRGHSVAVGNMKMLRDSGVKISLEAEKCFDNWSESGQTVIFCSINGNLALMLGLADTPRATARVALSMLKQLKISTIILTGDCKGAAAAVMKAVDGENYIANMKPEQKLQWIRDCQQTHRKKRRKVAMIGDGVNDGPSLAAADVGIAIGTCATALAIESANVALMSDSLVKIPELLLLSKFTKTVVIQNMALALAIKVAVIIATMAGVLTLWMAILSDVLALLLVILNGLRPLIWKPVSLKGSYDIDDLNNFDMANADVINLDEDGIALVEVKL